MQFEYFKKIIFFISTLFLILYIPTSIMIYSDSFYLINYETSTYNNLDEENIKLITYDITTLFLHKTNHLNKNLGWSENENKHFLDVRKIYDILFLIFIFSIFNFIYLFNKQYLKKNIKINFILIISLILLLPFFIFFWDNIFHKVLFSNNLWISESNSLMSILFPYSFFENCLIFLITISIIINYILYLILKNK